MKEIEIKVLDIDRKAIEQKLLSLGAKKIFEGIIKAHYFDTPDKKMRNSRTTVRLRNEGDKIILGVKTPLAGDRELAKIKQEDEIEVSDSDTMKKILESLGFGCWLTFSKRRISYSFDETRIEFDKYLNEYYYVPEFMEIEGESIETICAAAQKLGIRKEDCRPISGKEMLKMYEK